MSTGQAPQRAVTEGRKEESDLRRSRGSGICQRPYDEALLWGPAPGELCLCIVGSPLTKAAVLPATDEFVGC